jgi:hypothetical protein
MVTQDSNGNGWVFAGRSALHTRSLPTTPRFGVWVLSSPNVQVMGLFGPLLLGSPLAFCHLDDAGKPQCVDTKTSIARAVSVHVLRQGHAPDSPAPPSPEAATATPVAAAAPANAAPANAALANATPANAARASAAPASVVHVLWGQPVGEGVAVRCEADEVSGTVKCDKAQEKTQP